MKFNIHIFWHKLKFAQCIALLFAFAEKKLLAVNMMIETLKSLLVEKKLDIKWRMCDQIVEVNLLWTAWNLYPINGFGDQVWFSKPLEISKFLCSCHEMAKYIKHILLWTRLSI